MRAAEDDTLVGASRRPDGRRARDGPRDGVRDGQLSMDDAAGVALPGGEDVAFEPGGLHVMLEDLAAPLAAGE